ncbi:MAG: hypothetical protein ACFB51_07155, partial [Anaerolineae bacterium]
MGRGRTAGGHQFLEGGAVHRLHLHEGFGQQLALVVDIAEDLNGKIVAVIDESVDLLIDDARGHITV